MPLAVHLAMDVFTLLLSIQIFWPLELFQQVTLYKGQQSLPFASCSSQSIQLACCRHPLCARHFFRMDQDLPQCLSSLAGEAVKYYKYLGQKQWKHHGDSGEGATAKKLHQRADVRKGRGPDCKGNPIHHSFIHTLIPQAFITHLLFARNKELGIQR